MLVFLLLTLMCCSVWTSDIITNGDFNSELDGWDYLGVSITPGGFARLESESSYLKTTVELESSTTYCFKADAKSTDTITFDLGSHGSLSHDSNSWRTVRGKLITGEERETLLLEITATDASFVDNIQLLENDDCTEEKGPFADRSQFTMMGEAKFRKLKDGEIPFGEDTPPDSNEGTFNPGPDVVLVNGKVYKETDSRMHERKNKRAGKSLDKGRSFPGPEESEPARNEIVIGTDNRVLITATTSYPWRAFGGIHMGTNGLHHCSGTFIGPRHVITAAHCLFDRSTASWISPAVFWPGQSGNCAGTESAPYGTFTRVASVIPSAYFTTTPKSDSPVQYDYGMIILEDNSWSGCTTGWLGYSSNSDYQNQGDTINNAGYPASWLICPASPCSDDNCHGYLYYNYCTVSQSNTYDLRYNCDTQGGQSGSSMYFIPSGTSDRYQVAIHKGSPDGSVNWGRKINSDLFDWIYNKKYTEYPSTSC